MKKMFFFPSWNLASVEEKLHALALQGYRLVRVAFSHVFVFQKANTEDVRHNLLSLPKVHGLGL